MDMTEYLQFLRSAEKNANKWKDSSHFYRTSYSPTRKYSDIRGTTTKPVILRKRKRAKEHKREREIDDFSSLSADKFLKMYIENNNKISEHNQNVKLYANEKRNEKRQKDKREIVKTKKKSNEKSIKNQDKDKNKKEEKKEKENSQVSSKAKSQKTEVENKITNKDKKKADNTSEKGKSRKTEKTEIENKKRSAKHSTKIETAKKNGRKNNVNKAQIDFKTLLQLAEKKQHEPVPLNAIKTEERPLTAKEKQFFEDIRLAREKRKQATKEKETSILIGERSNKAKPQKVKKRLKKPIKFKQISKAESDHDDDELSEFDDFIDDDDEIPDVSAHIREIFGYDKSKYKNSKEDDIIVESSFAQIQREELVSKRIGLKEDLDDMRLENLNKLKKRKLSLTSSK